MRLKLALAISAIAASAVIVYGTGSAITQTTTYLNPARKFSGPLIYKSAKSGTLAQWPGGLCIFPRGSTVSQSQSPEWWSRQRIPEQHLVRSSHGLMGQSKSFRNAACATPKSTTNKRRWLI